MIIHQFKKSNSTSEQLKKCQFVTVARINNESELYDIVNLTGIIDNLKPVETIDKNEKKFTYAR